MPPYAVADCIAARSRYALLPANCMSHLSCVGQHSPCCAGMTVPAVCFLFPCCRFGLFFFQYFCRAGTVVQGGRSQAFCRCRMMRYRVSIPTAHPPAAVCAVVYLPAAHSSCRVAPSLSFCFRVFHGSSALSAEHIFFIYLAPAFLTKHNCHAPLIVILHSS